MNEHDLSGLSYRDLQALAARYRVPGNIKKYLLVGVLQAIRSGDKSEVERMLVEVHQTRKKRVKKSKSNEMNVSSTPIHSPNYTMSNDCYYSRNQPPYQWVGAEEEIAMREENSMRVPNYDEFQQFLLHRIHRERDYQPYNSNENNGLNSSIVDLRMGAGTSIPRPIFIDTNNTESNIMLNPNSYVRPCRDVELHVLEDKSSNNQPMLLKKMLEAPAGANLGEIASPDANSNKMWSVEQTQNNTNNPLDGDSDTLTAGSDIDYNDTWNNNNNNDNNPNNYSSVMNNNETTQLYNENDTSNKCTQNIHQLQNNFPHDGNYQFEYPAIEDPQANCEKWLATNKFASKDTNYPEMFGNSRNRSVNYENTLGNSSITKMMNRERKFEHNGGNFNYEMNSNVHEQRSNWSNEQHQYYQSNVESNAINNPNDVYFSQQIAKSEVRSGQDFFGHGGQNDNIHTEIVQMAGPAQYGENVFNNKGMAANFHQNHEMHYNSGFYSQYTHENNQTMVGFSNQENPQQQQQQQHQQQTNVVIQESNQRKNVLAKFWPRWPINATVTSDGQLETILNLHNDANVNFMKMRETSCVYCCTELVVAQSTQTSHSWCAQKRLIAEERQHLFTANSLVYNDASTGMQMANIDESTTSIVDAQEPMIDEPSTASVDQISEHQESSGSSEHSLNDVWIHDYSSYPVTSENSLQRVELTNDENDEDLFSTVRSASQTSIDDQIIETFTRMSY